MEESQEKPLEIYSARLIFRRTKNKKFLSVQIRYQKNSKSLKERLPFPEDIRIDELSWVKHQRNIKENIAVYHRLDNNYRYVNSKNSLAHTSLSQKLEKIVRDIVLKYEKRLKYNTKIET